MFEERLNISSTSINAQKRIIVSHRRLSIERLYENNDPAIVPQTADDKTPETPPKTSPTRHGTTKYRQNDYSSPKLKPTLIGNQ